MENKRTRHGMRKTRIYSIWRSMKCRCSNKNNKSYGAKGITVCEEWKEFINFKDWSFANGYKDDLTIDRIDNSKGYCPENCRWVDMTTQARNKSTNNKILTKIGIVTAPELAEKNNISYTAIKQRITKLKKQNLELTEENILKGFELGEKHKKYIIIHNGVKLSVKQFSQLKNINEKTLHAFLKRKNKTTINSDEIKLKESLKVKIGDTIKTLKDYSLENKLCFTTLYYRAKKISKNRIVFEEKELINDWRCKS